MNQVQSCLIELMKYALNEQPLPDRLKSVIANNTKEIIIYAKTQRTIPFLRLFDEFQEGEYKKPFRKLLAECTFKDIMQEMAVGTVLDSFEKNGIYCVPLKGIRTKQLYPSGELRTMGDLDILYKKEQTFSLRAVMKQLGYKFYGNTVKHDKYRKDEVSIEMHKDLLSAESRGYEYFRRIWERVAPEPGKTYIYQMSPEDHYLFTIYHLMEHFIHGGIGIRMVLDIYILSRDGELDWNYLNRELQVLEIDEFEKNIRELSHYWFDGKWAETHSPAESLERFGALEDYIVNGDAYGNIENALRNNSLCYKSGIGYFFHMSFPPYTVMQTVYPWLNTQLLLPAAWLHRALSVCLRRRRNIGKQLQTAYAMGKQKEEEKSSRKVFFAQYGLKVT